MDILGGAIFLRTSLRTAILAGAVAAVSAGTASAQDDTASTPLPSDPGAMSSVERTGTSPPGQPSDRIYFIPGTDEVDEPGMKLLLASAGRLKSDPRLILRLTAYTANMGSRSYNLAIADEEVNTVTGLLRTFGVPIRQIRRQGAGGIPPAQDCADQDCKEAKFVTLRYE